LNGVLQRMAEHNVIDFVVLLHHIEIELRQSSKPVIVKPLESLAPLSGLFDVVETLQIPAVGGEAFKQRLHLTCAFFRCSTRTRSHQQNRREALKNIATAGAGALLTGEAVFPRERTIEIAGRPIEVTITAITPQTVRVTIHPIENGQPVPVPRDGALIQADWSEPALRWRPIAGTW
jgi:hypothetical protein